MFALLWVVLGLALLYAWLCGNWFAAVLATPVGAGLAGIIACQIWPKVGMLTASDSILILLIGAAVAWGPVCFWRSVMGQKVIVR